MIDLPVIIPPRSRVCLISCETKSPDCLQEIGRCFRIGYYRPKDGIDCIWLVNESGEYEQTTDRKSLLKHYEILRLSNETDYFGVSHGPLKPLSKSSRKLHRSLRAG